MKKLILLMATAILLASCQKNYVAPAAELSISKDPSDIDRVYNFPLTHPVIKDVDLGTWILDPQGTTITLEELPTTLSTNNNYYGYYAAASLVNSLYVKIDGKLAATEGVSLSLDSTGRNVIKFVNLHRTFNKPIKVNFRGNISSNSSGSYNPLNPYTATAVIDITGSNVLKIVAYDSDGKQIKNTSKSQHISGVTEGSLNTFNFY